MTDVTRNVQIEIEPAGPGEPRAFRVLLRDADGEAAHEVTMDAATTARLCGDRPAEACMEAAFRFLLDREPRQSILSRFDITVIGRYFPEFEAELPRYLERVR